ncbi:MAG: L-threonylcarbamoyladenylate synthase [Oscillospiraceae bacterium]
MTEYQTRLMQADDPAAIELAARLLRAGEVVAIPTETVYGLAADATNPDAVRRVFEVKGRPQDNPLIVHISDLSMWRPLVQALPEAALRLAEAFWPGPLTIILKKSDVIPATTTAGLGSVAVRMPSHPGARAVIAAAGVALAAPSANLSGFPSTTTAQHCVSDLWGKIPLILDGGACPVGIESTVISLDGPPMLLRPGAITPEQLSEALGVPVAVSHAVSEPLAEGEHPSSPGMKYRHYAPKAHVVLVEGSREGFLRLLEASPEGTFGLVFAGDETGTGRPCVVYGTAHDAASQARGLFSALRELDARGASLVYARCPDHAAALGVYNRMLRAAAFEVKQV